MPAQIGHQVLQRVVVVAFDQHAGYRCVAVLAPQFGDAVVPMGIGWPCQPVGLGIGVGDEQVTADAGQRCFDR